MNTLNERLIKSFYQDAPLGLSNGKIGFCLFAFWLARQEKNRECQKMAEDLLDDVFRKSFDTNEMDVLDGVAGIGLVIRYLLKESYIKGLPNIVLRHLDDALFKHLSYVTHLDVNHVWSDIQILYYLCLRLEDQKKRSESEYLYQELIIAIINRIYQKINSSFFEEPLHFNIRYPLPQFLFVLSRLLRLDFYNYRIIKMLEDFSRKVRSIFPTLHANRLFLIWSMDSIVQQVNLTGLDSHVQLLIKNLNVDAILDEEILNRNINIISGFSGIYLLLSAVQRYFSKDNVFQWMNRIIGKIEISDIWNLADQDPTYLLQNRGLLSGFCGVSMILADAESKYLQI